MIVETKHKNLADMFFRRAETTPNKRAYSFKKGDKWETITWSEAKKIVLNLASGLLNIGIKKGDKVNIFSYTCVEWVLSDFASLSCGAITVPIYQSLPPDQAEYIINDSESKLIFVENDEILQKVISVRKNITNVKKIILFKNAKQNQKEDEWVMTYDELLMIGERNQRFTEIEEIVRNIKQDEVATIVYTSGTTGPPKGVVQTHRNHLSMCAMIYETGNFRDDDSALLFLPLAHSFARQVEFALAFIGGHISFAESIEKVAQNIAEVKPTLLPSVPRIFEKVYATVISQAQESPIKKKIFNWALNTGIKVSRLKQKKKEKNIPFLLSIQNRIADKLVFKKLRNKLGGNLRVMVSGGAPISKEIEEFFHAFGLLIIEGYGLTETCPALTINRIDDFKFGTVGKPLKGVELKIADDGEILARGPNVVSGYYKKEKDTKEAFSDDGWFKTGDIGEIDEDGFLRITDRKKDLIVTAAGKNIAPQNVENLLKSLDPLISQVVMIGDKRPYCVALITLNKEEVEKFLQDSEIKATENAKVIDRISKAVSEVNSKVASYETIKKFKILPNDFTIESGELTPTLKVKRKIVMQNYQDIIEEMYKTKNNPN